MFPDDESDLSNRVNDDEVREAVQRRVVILFILRSTMELGVKRFFLLVLKRKKLQGIPSLLPGPVIDITTLNS